MSFAIKNDNETLIIADCPMCGTESRVVIPTHAYELWQAGCHIQNVAPELKPEQREVLISGICPKCWDKMFGDEQ